MTYPATPLQVQPGALATFPLHIGNTGHSPLTVLVSPRKVLLSEDGVTNFAVRPDPLFAGLPHIVPARFTLKGRQEKVVTVSLRMPAQLRPDDYFLGFLVSPVITSPSVRAVNDVGALVVLDIPGARAPRLAAWFVHLPHIVWSSSVKAQVRAKSTGVSTLQFTTDTLISGLVAPRPRVIMEPPHLLPPGLYWDVPVACVVVARAGLVHDPFDPRLQPHRPAHRRGGACPHRGRDRPSLARRACRYGRHHRAPRLASPTQAANRFRLTGRSHSSASGRPTVHLHKPTRGLAWPVVPAPRKATRP